MTSAAIDSVAILVDDLPDVARDLVQLIGLQHAVTLVEHLGGTTFPVAGGSGPFAQVRYAMLSELVGVTAADKLTEAYGGTRLYIPRCAEALRQARNRAICTEFDALIAVGNDCSGKDAVFFLARKYRLSDRAIWTILKATDMMPISDKQYQATLF